jgi:cytidylate kinase
MAVIAINQQVGSRGRELGRLLAEHLGYRYIVGEDIIAQTASRYRVPANELRIIDERYLRFWERLKTDMERLFAYMRAVSLLEMARDRVVMVGKSFSLMVPMQAQNALRVRAIAPLVQRAAQVAAEENLDANAAERRVYNSDREERARIHALLGEDPDDPSLYHLVINTAALPFARLVTMLAGCVETCERAADPASRELLYDSAVAALVRAAFLSHPQFGNAPINVSARQGVVTLSGECLTPPWDELAIQVAGEVEGVKSVELTVFSPMPPERPV